MMRPVLMLLAIFFSSAVSAQTAPPTQEEIEHAHALCMDNTVHARPNSVVMPGNGVSPWAPGFAACDAIDAAWAKIAQPRRNLSADDRGAADQAYIKKIAAALADQAK